MWCCILTGHAHSKVKGGDTIKHNGREWFRDTKGGHRKFQDPFEQARRNMHALLSIVKERSGGKIQRFQVVHGYAVVFPHMDYEGEPPPHSDKTIIISRRQLTSMSDSVEFAFEAWTESSQSLQANLYRTLLHDCLMPKFKIFRPVGPDIELATQRLLELTETQAKVFEGLYSQERVLVEGVAGSGKTFLALHKAIAFAREGKDVLFTCYNKDLAEWVRRQVKEDPTTQGCRCKHLSIYHFHGLARRLSDDAGIAFSPTNGGEMTSEFWTGRGTRYNGAGHLRTGYARSTPITSTLSS